MKKGPEVSPAAVIAIIAVVVVVIGVVLWQKTGPSAGTSGVGATSAALAHENKPMKVVMPTNLPGGGSNIPMPGKTPTMPMGGTK